MSENRNMVLAIVLSAIVLFGWQYFIGMPKVAQQHKETAQTQQQTPAAPGQPAAPSATPAAPQGSATVPNSMTRKAALAASLRIAIDTPRIKGSIALKGARVDDVSLATYHETVDDKSPDIVLLSPAGGPDAFYAEFGWVSGDSNTKLPDADTVWTQDGSGALTPDHPITLSWDNGQGLVFKRTIAIDSQYMFTLSDAVENKGTSPVSLHEYGIVSRHGIPHIQGYYVLHEGPVGVLGDGKLYEPSYKDIEKPMDAVKTTGGWLGITDKYWAAALIPDQSATMKGQFYARDAANGVKTYQAMFVRDPVTLAPGAQTSAKVQLFAGAKEVALIDGYEKNLDIKRFDLLIDWGWFYFITRPMFRAMDFFYRLFGNFGIAILLVTVLVKLLFFPLANKSYASMAKMKMVQPQMQALKEKYPDDKMKQQQELMELYKKEKINPVAGCLPIVIQIPVFFALYKVLFVTIEMRHAPFFGWIKDLSAPDPTNIFNLFGLIPIDPTALPMFGHFLHLGIWPLIMGCTMWAQMKMNPAPPDPTQKMIFAWMPVVFTFMLSSFSAGLVIYWAWNNFLSVMQQGVIMKKNGVKIELFDNLKSMFRKNPTPS